MYHEGSLPHPLRKERNHQLYCQLEGEKEVLLVAEEDFPSWSRAGIREDPVVGDVAVTVAAHSVDFEAHPEIREIKKMSIARFIVNIISIRKVPGKLWSLMQVDSRPVSVRAG